MYIRESADAHRQMGNSLAVRLPVELAQRLGVKEGDEVSVTLKGERTIEFRSKKRPIAEELLVRVSEITDKFPADFAFDRDEAKARR